MKKLLFAVLFSGASAFVSNAMAQTPSPTQLPAKPSSAPIPIKRIEQIGPVTAADLSPPIPIIRGIVDAAVREQAAYILTPEQVEVLKKASSEVRKANVSQYPDGFISKPVSRSFSIDSDSMQQTRMVRLSAGAITSMVFTDMSGNPWLIKSVSFDCGNFNDGTCNSAAGGANQKPTNIVKIQPVIPYAYGNIVIELEDMASPIIFMLSAGQSNETDIRIDARIAGRNPNAKPQAIFLERMPEHDMAMGNFLDGVAPDGAIRLKITGGQAEGWVLNGALYLRTRLSVLSPAFVNKVGSADGINVFKYFSVVPQLLASVDGKPTTLYISGY